MVISFEEKDRAVIESKGITIIEFKRDLYKIKKGIEYAWEVLKEIGDRIKKAWNVVCDAFHEVMDSIELVGQVVREVHDCPTSFRYKVVKILSKCTGIEMWKLWKASRHTWLARSNC